MDDNLKIILSKFEELKGQFVINHKTVERLIAIGTDEMDYYYITFDGVKPRWNTCVGNVIPLKGKIEDKHYEEFIRLAKINHADQPNRWMPRTEEAKIETLKSAEEFKKMIGETTGTDRYLTDICWDLN